MTGGFVKLVKHGTIRCGEEPNSLGFGCLRCWKKGSKNILSNGGLMAFTMVQSTRNHL